MNPHTLDRPLQVVRICLHILVAVLLVLAVARAVVGAPSHIAAVVGAAVLVGILYALGTFLKPVAESHWAAAAWLTAVGLAWIALLVATPDGIWLAFPLFFIQLHLLPTRWGITAVAVTTVVAIAGFAWHRGGFDAGMVIGPVIGAGVAVVTVVGYQVLYRQSQERQVLIDQLRAAHDDLAAAEHSAGVLAERERLSREIHDTLAQGFSSIQLLLRAAERVLDDRPSDAEGYITKARETAHDNLAEARRLVYALVPAELEGASLPAALERLCATTQDRAELAVNFHLSGEPHDVATPIEVAVLRVAQSALANTVQHANASRVDVTLTYVQGGVAVDVVDDGTGFDPTAVSGSDIGGFGLSAMRARARTLGGSLHIESGHGEGTALAASFPDAASTRASINTEAGTI